MSTELFILGAILAGISNMFFGLLVYANNRGTLFGKMFFAVSTAFSIWILAYAIWLAQPFAQDALFWSRMLNLGATLIPIFFFHWVLAFLGEVSRHKKILISGYVLTFLFASLSFTDGYITHVAQVGHFMYWPQAGTLYSVFLIVNFVGLFGYAIFLLLRFLKNTADDDPRRLQGKYILIGSVISVIGGSSNFPLMYGFPFLAELTLLTIFHPFFWAYGALRHHFFNMKVLATEVLIFALWIFLLARTIFAETLQDQFVEAVLLVLTIVIGILLIRSVYKEVHTRERMENLAEDLKHANERLKELDQQKSEFVSIASHQLRSPLTAIKGYGSMLLEGSFGKVPEKLKEPVEKMYHSSQLLVNLVEDLLNVTRIEQGRMQYEKANIDIAPMIENIIEEVEPNITHPDKVTVELNVDKKQKYTVSADEAKIRQVFLNLIDNAIKYTPEGTITVSLSKPDKGHVLFSVSDEGIGFSEGFKQKDMFGKFNRASNGQKLHASGSGIGLYVAKEITEAHDGEIWAESEGEGKGATFYVELPAA